MFKLNIKLLLIHSDVKKYKRSCYKKDRTLCSISLKKYVYAINIVEIFYISFL